MNKKMKNSNSFSKVMFLLIISTVLIGVITNPELSLESATTGISIWLNIIIPSLLPFFIISEILIRFGFVDFIGKLLGPMMNPLFNVSGQGAFPLAMAVISGYPVGSKLTSRLREEKSISKTEGDKLICFTSTSGPLFMLGAVSIGMLKDQNIGLLVVLPHYFSVILIGVIIKFLKKEKINTSNRSKNIFDEIHESYKGWLNTKKSIGSLITESIKESMDTIILIGGLIIFYSVLVEILFNFEFVNNFITKISNLLSIDKQLTKGTIVGFFELTTGCKNIAMAEVSLIQKILIINFIIGWGGISVHSQALSFINNTDINSKLYIVSKFLHGIFSALITYIVYLLKFQDYSLNTFLGYSFAYESFSLSNWLYLLMSSLELVITINIFVLLISIFIYNIVPRKA